MKISLCGDNRNVQSQVSEQELERWMHYLAEQMLWATCRDLYAPVVLTELNVKSNVTKYELATVFDPQVSENKLL